jgi:hypothetical protein
MRVNYLRAVGAGLAGTAVMTAVGIWAAPMMGIPRMNPAEMLAGQMGGNLAPWLMAQVVVMPMMGMPLFSGSMAMAMGSLVGHLVYGVVIGAMIGDPATQGG